MLNVIQQLDLPRLGILVGFTAIVSGAAIAISAILSHNWRKVRQSEIDAALKAQMLEQGLSAQEVEQVISASPRGRRKYWQEFAANHLEAAAQKVKS